MAEAYCELGLFDDVLECAPAALAINRETANYRSEVLTLCHLARAIAATRDPKEAQPLFRRALELGREVDDLHAQAWALDCSGTAALARGAVKEAIGHWREAAELFEQLEDPRAAEIRAHIAAWLAPPTTLINPWVVGSSPTRVWVGAVSPRSACGASASACRGSRSGARGAVWAGCGPARRAQRGRTG